MHDTAHEHGRLFFQLYTTATTSTVIELGSQDVNGSLRSHCPPGIHYIGLDVMPAKSVDVIINPTHPLPLASSIADAVVTSSVFEHDICFWNTFLELIRILRPGGLLYLNAPSNGGFHRHPLDCWRFYPDAGTALAQWATRNGQATDLIESFIGQPKSEQWADFVAVFRKAGGGPLTRRGRIADHAPAINITDLGTRLGAPLQAMTEIMPHMQLPSQLRAALTAEQQRNAALSANLQASTQQNATLSAERDDAIRRATDLSAALDTARQLAATLQEEAANLRQTRNAAEHRAQSLEQTLAQTSLQLAAIRDSTFWRLTAGLRRLTTAIRRR